MATIPHELSDLFLANPTTCYNVLFRTVQRTVCEISREAFGCQPGVIMTLHTWGQEMRTHIHIHAIVSAGGIPCTRRKPTPRRRKQSTELPTTGPSTAVLVTKPESVTDSAQTVWIPIPGGAVAFEPRQLADRFRDLLVAELLKSKRTAAYSVFWGRGACKCSVVDFAKDPAAPLTPHTSRPLHPTAWPPFSTGALAGGVRGGGAEGADRA